MNRREFHCLAFGAALAAAGHAKAGNVERTARIAKRARELAGDDPTPLNMMIPGGSRANIRPLAKAFTEATGIGFNISETPVDDINARTLLSVVTKRAIDVSLPATFGIPDLAEAGVLQPLDSYAERYDAQGLVGESLYALGDRYNSQLYGYQTDGDVYLMFYNKAMLEEPTLAAAFSDRFGYQPKPARTWTELDRLLEFFHRPEQNQFGGCLFRGGNYIGWEWWIRLHANGRLPFDEDMRPQVDSPEGVAALESLVTVSRYQTEEARHFDIFECWKTFAKGNVLCMLGWGGSQKYLRLNQEHLVAGLIHAPTPGGLSPNGYFDVSYFNWGWNFAVPSTSTQPEIAYLFTLFASAPEISTLAVREADGFFDPHRTEHYSDPVIRQTYGDQFLEVHRKAMRQAIPDLYLRGRNQYMEILSKYLVRVDLRDITPIEALRSVSQQWDELTDILGRDEQARQWNLVKQRYPAATLKHLR